MISHTLRFFLETCPLSPGLPITQLRKPMCALQRHLRPQKSKFSFATSFTKLYQSRLQSTQAARSQSAGLQSLAMTTGRSRSRSLIHSRITRKGICGVFWGFSFEKRRRLRSNCVVLRMLTQYIVRAQTSCIYSNIMHTPNSVLVRQSSMRIKYICDLLRRARRRNG
ncbi:hypothetical protein K437DRAFT_51319 [Tilletiaria anomala UBC 951]|uniref:Uncharacterized protein n=1 Tax=Tilletiaria anomala (strain ATCC 24038 / CBS 436.72 / UBC 951) TaxID=1037660 RepID=A0A066WLB2_TILAU|nr:uncharacterized protein K437DRAFT_51319 [Tilletiaria anomala UBC 951]KDN51415.1 hypothetical protein K437DRAFT_51319 [Tilletiaria anomala UBC 951]